MIYCPECGYPNDDSEHRCEKCAIRFDFELETTESASAEVSAPTPPVRTVPTWQKDVRERMLQFRQRRGLQAALPLEDPLPVEQAAEPVEKKPEGKLIVFPSPAKEEQPEAPPTALATPAPVRSKATSKRPAPLEEQQALNFPLPPQARPVSRFLEFPVAPLQVRLISAATDAAMVAIGYGLLFMAYHFLGGALPFSGSRAQTRLAAVVLLSALALLPLFYHFLFLLFTAGTPGMIWTGLRLVDFDGRPASRARRLSRILASAASAGPLFLGFLWASVDQERLTWHDRMSETCLIVVYFL